MSIEVANLIARISMVAEGFPDVLRRAEEVRTKLEEVGKSGAGAAQKISENQVKAVVALNRFTRATDLAREAEAKYNRTVKQTGTDAAGARKELEGLERQIETLKQAASGPTVAASDIAQLKGLEARRKVLQTVIDAETAVGRAEAKRISAAERFLIANNRLADETGKTAKRTRLLTTEITGLISAFRNGEIGSTLLARGLIRLAASGVLALNPITLIIGALVAMTAIIAKGAAAAFNSDLSKTAQQLNILNPQLVQMADNLREISNVSTAERATLIDTAVNQLRGAGFRRPEQAAGVAAGLANALQFTNAVPDDFDKASQAATRFLASLDASSLAEYGIEVERVQRLVEELGERGFSRTRIAAAALAEVKSQLAARSGELSAQADREAKSLDGVRNIITRVKELFAQILLSQPVQEFIDALRRMMPVITSAISGLTAIALVFLKVGTTLMNVVSTAFVAVQKGLLNFTQTLIDVAKEVSKFLGMTEQAEWLEKASQSIDTAREKYDEWLDTLRNPPSVAFLEELEGDLGGIASTAREAKDRVREFFDVLNNGQSLVDSVVSLSVAWHNMTESLTPGTAVASLAQFNRVLDMVVMNGIESLDLLRLRAQAAFAAGFINKAQLDAAIRGYDLIGQAVAPIAEEAAKVRDKLQGSLPAGFDATSASAVNATGTVQTFISTLNQIPRQKVVDIIANFRGASLFGFNFSGGSIGRVGGSSDRRAPVPTTRPRTPALNTGNFSVPADMAARIGVAPSLRPPPTNPADFGASLKKIFDAFVPKTGGGGGAGGALASLAQIQELFRRVNDAIKIGINNNIRFGTAGNTIPTGAPGEFLNTKGGVLIQTLNLRGFWDFTDPAAKRDIVRQLKELLAELSREDA